MLTVAARAAEKGVERMERVIPYMVGCRFFGRMRWGVEMKRRQVETARGKEIVVGNWRRGRLLGSGGAAKRRLSVSWPWIRVGSTVGEMSPIIDCTVAECGLCGLMPTVTLFGPV